MTRRLHELLLSDAAGRHVTEDLAIRSDEDDAVTGRISLVSFHLLIRHRNPRPVRNDSFAVGNDSHVLIARNFKIVSLEGIRLPTAGLIRIVGLHEALEPLPHGAGLITPLAEISCRGRQSQQHEDNDDPDHERLL